MRRGRQNNAARWARRRAELVGLIVAALAEGVAPTAAALRARYPYLRLTDAQWRAALKYAV